jgi:flagellin-like protein
MFKSTTDRAISPVVGGVLLLAITIALVSFAGYVILGAGDTGATAPTVTVSLEETENPAVYRLSYESGSSSLGSQTELQGVADRTVLQGTEVVAGTDIEVTPVSDEVRLVWDDGDGRSYTLQTFSVDPVLEGISVSDIDYECDWAESEINNQGDLDLVSGDVLRCDIVDGVSLDPGVNNIAVDMQGGAILVGTIDTDGDVDLDNATVTESVTTDANDIVMTNESTVYGDVVAQSDTNIDIDGDSRVLGAVVVNGGSLSLDSVTVEGHVYVDEDDISGCSGGTTIGPNGESCSEYEFRDPADY